MAEKKKRDGLTEAAEYLASQEEGYIPPGHPSTKAALDRWFAIPMEQRNERREEAVALGDLWTKGRGKKPPEEVAFSRANGSRWAVEQPAPAKPAGMADLRRSEDSRPGARHADVSVEPLRNDDGDASRFGASMASARKMDEAGLLGMGPEPEQDWRDGKGRITPPAPDYKDASMFGASMKTGPAKQRRPGVDVKQAGQADAGGMWERLRAAGRAPLKPETLAKVRDVSPLVAQHLEPRDELTEAREQASRSTLGVRLARAGAMANEALSGAKYERPAYDDLEADAQQPVDDVFLRRKMGQEDAQLGMARAREGREHAREGREASESQRVQALYDASSERSRTARAQLLLRFPDRAAKIPQEQLANMSAADVAEYLKGFDDDRGYERQLGQDKAAERRHREELAARSADRSEARAARIQTAQDRRDDRATEAETKRTDKFERENEKDMAEFGKRSDGLARTAQDARTINSYMEEGGDIPGAGVWDSFKMENGLTRALFASKDDVESWQASQRMAASYLNTMTGQSFTPLEAERTLARYGVRTGATEQEWRSGMTAFMRDVKAGLVQKEAPYRHVVPEFRRRGGTTAQDIPDPAPEGTGEFMEVDGVVYEVLNNGKARPVR